MENPTAGLAPADMTMSDLERSKSRSLTFCVVGDLYIICSIVVKFWVSHKRSRGQAGFSTVPEIFLV